MGKINSAEKFYIEKISKGFNINKKELTKNKIEIMFSSTLEENKELYRDIKNALDVTYISDVKTNENLKEKYSSNLIKIYKGRETFLRDSIIKWYSDNSIPSIKNIYLLLKKSFSMGSTRD